MNVLDYISAYGTHEGLLKAWDTRGRHGAEGFVSPSHEDINFDEALKRLRSEEQRQFISQANGLVKQVVGKGEVKSAIGDWKDGAENSSIIVSSSAKKEDMAYITAKLGAMSQQKAVLVFGRDKAGSDTIWTFEDGPNVNEVRQALDRVGLDFRTVIPGQKTEVHIFDQGSKLRDAVGKVAAQFGGDVRFSRGTGEFIGGDTREEGKQKFQQVISQYEKARQIH
jgi:hypothetical protein